MSLFVVDIRKKVKNNPYVNESEYYVLYNTVIGKFKELNARAFKTLLMKAPNRVVNAKLVLKKDAADYMYTVDKYEVKGKTGSFDTFISIMSFREGANSGRFASPFLLPHVYTVIDYYDWSATRYYTVIDNMQEIKTLMAADLVQIIQNGDNVVVNAKLVRNQGRLLISGINWSIPMKKDRRKIDKKKDALLKEKLQSELNRESPDLEWDKICVLSFKEISNYFKCIYSGKLMRKAVKATDYSLALPAKYDIVPWNEFEIEFLDTCITNFKKELGIENVALSSEVEELIKKCVWKFFDFKKPKNDMELNQFLGILKYNPSENNPFDIDDRDF